MGYRHNVKLKCTRIPKWAHVIFGYAKFPLTANKQETIKNIWQTSGILHVIYKCFIYIYILYTCIHMYVYKYTYCFEKKFITQS